MGRMKITHSPDRPLHWVGSSKKDLLRFSDDIVSDVGFALGVVQQGGMPPSAKHWKGEGAVFWKLWKIIWVIRFVWFTPSDLSRRFMCCIVSRRNHRLGSELQAQMWI